MFWRMTDIDHWRTGGGYMSSFIGLMGVNSAHMTASPWSTDFTDHWETYTSKRKRCRK